VASPLLISPLTKGGEEEGPLLRRREIKRG